MSPEQEIEVVKDLATVSQCVKDTALVVSEMKTDFSEFKEKDYGVFKTDTRNRINEISKFKERLIGAFVLLTSSAFIFLIGYLIKAYGGT